MKNKILLVVGILIAVLIYSPRFLEFSNSLNKSEAAHIDKDIEPQPTAQQHERHLRKNLKMQRYI